MRGDVSTWEAVTRRGSILFQDCAPKGGGSSALSRLRASARGSSPHGSLQTHPHSRAREDGGETTVGPTRSIT